MAREKRQKVSDVGPLPSSLPRGTQETKETNNVNPGWDSDGDDEIVVNSDVQLLDDVDSDTGLYTLVKAIRVIQSQFLQTCPHFVPVSHLYAYMRKENGTDETDVDIAVEELKKRHLVTCLYMPGARDVALVETGDYIKAIHHLASNASNLLLKKACEWFEDVVKKYCGPIFPGSGDEQTGSGSKQSNRSSIYLQLLLQNDFILRIPRNNSQGGETQELFGFKMPHSGEVVRSIVSGRNEILSKIKRKKNGEILVSKMNTIPLQKTCLTMEWHVKDLVGSGLVHVVQTTVGPSLRVLKE